MPRRARPPSRCRSPPRRRSACGGRRAAGPASSRASPGCSTIPEWPEAGAKVVWESGPGGRGRVTEKVIESGAAALRDEGLEERLVGTQAFRAEPAEGGALVEVELEYELTSESPLRGVTDVLFIRRALRDALRRTLRRFKVEAEEEPGCADGASDRRAKHHWRKTNATKALEDKVVAITGRRGDRARHGEGVRGKGMKVAIGDLDEADRGAPPRTCAGAIGAARST